MRVLNHLLLAVVFGLLLSPPLWAFPSMQPGMPAGHHQPGEEATAGSPDNTNPPAEHLPPPAPTHGDASSILVARINNVAIPMSTLTRMMRQIIIQNYRREQLTPEISVQVREKAMDRVILEELAYQRAQSLGVKITAEKVAAQIDRMKEEMGSDDHFQAYLARKAISEDELGPQVERFLAVREAIRQEVDSTIQVSPEEISELYKKVREQFVQPEAVEVTDVVFFLDAASATDKAQAEEVHARLVDQFAGEPANLPSAPIYVVRPEIQLKREQQPELYEAAKKLEPSQISAVLEIDETLHVIKLTGYQPRTEKTEAEVRPDLERNLRSGKRQAALEAWKAGLKDGAAIEIFDVTVRDEAKTNHDPPSSETAVDARPQAR